MLQCECNLLLLFFRPTDTHTHTLILKRRMLLLLIQFSCNTDQTEAIKADCTVHKPIWCYVTTIFQVLFHFHLDWARNEALFLKKILTSFFSIVHRFSIELNGNCVRMCTKRIKLAMKKKQMRWRLSKLRIKFITDKSLYKILLCLCAKER